MKAKLKFDMDKVKEFGKEHGEKFGLALAVLILGSFIVKAVSRERLPENLEPDKIVGQSHNAEQKIKGVAVPPPAQDVSLIDLSLVGKEVGFGPKGIAIDTLIQPAIPDLVKRVDPTTFPVEELRVAWFRGGIPISAQLGGIRNPPPGPPPPTGQIAPAGGLVPSRPATGRGVRGAAGAAARPAVGAPVVGLGAGGVGNAAAGPQPFPPDFHQPGPQSSGFAEGRDGIVVTGLIPEQAQREEYARRFKNARRGVMVEGAAGNNRGRDRAEIEADSPQYVWCWLERTDTTEGKTIVLDFGDTEEVVHAVQQPDETLRADVKQQVKELAMSPATRKKIEAEEHRWAMPGGEVVEKDYLAEPWFSWELPPVLLRDWGAEAAHPPKIPLAMAAAQAGPADGGPVGPGGQPGGDDIFSKADAAGAGAGPVAGPVRRHDAVGLGAKAQAADVPYKLFRFVDLNVEPGHAYQYRVRMLLRNPNFGLEPQVLLKPDTATVAYRPTPWSEMSPSVSIPQNTRLLGGSIDRPKRMEPKAKIGIFTFDPVQAVALLKEFDTELGALVGSTVPDQTIKGFADPVTRQIRDITGDFRSPAVLLDFRGEDEKLPGAGGLSDPAEMLLLDDIDHPENPRLIVVNEAKDKSVIEAWKKTHVPAAAPAANAAPGGLGAPAAKPAGGGLIPGGGGLLPPRTSSPTRRPTGR